MAGVVSAVLFAAVLLLILWQPRGLSIGWTASLGGLAALAAGLVTVRDVVTVVSLVWDATATFVALILISMVLDEAGLFAWAALHMARMTRGRGLALFWGVGLLGAAVAMLFANDGAALILTPLVYEQTRVLRLDRRATLALILVSGFIADTTSIPLVISNLVNIISADFFHLGFVAYATVMTPVDLVALGASMGMLYWYYRRDLPARVEVEALPDPSQAVRDQGLFRAAWWVLALLLVGYIVSQRVGWPVSLFSAAAAAALLALAWRSPAVSVRSVLRHAPWHIVTFSIGMYVVVFGLRRAGLLALLSQGLLFSYRAGPIAAVLGSGTLAAVLSASMNNLPAVMMEALAIAGTSLPQSVRHLMAYANVVGCDLGPRLTPIGSLATLLWLHVLERRGLRISWGYLWKVGMALTPPTLLATLLGLAVWSSWLR